MTTEADEIHRLRAEIERLRTVSATDVTVMRDDVIALMEALGMDPYVRPVSTHRCMEEKVIPEVTRLRAALEKIATEDLDEGELPGLGEEAMLADAVSTARRALRGET